MSDSNSFEGWQDAEQAYDSWDSMKAGYQSAGDAEPPINKQEAYSQSEMLTAIARINEALIEIMEVTIHTQDTPYYVLNIEEQTSAYLNTTSDVELELFKRIIIKKRHEIVRWGYTKVVRNCMGTWGKIDPDVLIPAKYENESAMRRALDDSEHRAYAQGLEYLSMPIRAHHQRNEAINPYLLMEGDIFSRYNFY